MLTRSWQSTAPWVSYNFSLRFRLNASTATTPMLAPSDVKQSTATLTISNHTAAWYYKGNQSGAQCRAVSAGTTTANLSSLTGNRAHVYKAYADSDCTSAYELTTAASDAHFITLDLTAGSITQTTATLRIHNYTSSVPWYHKQTSPGSTSCTAVPAGTTTYLVENLTPSRTYTWRAYSDTTCTNANQMAIRSFTTQADNDRPTVISGGFSPADGATDVAKTTNLVISFNEPVRVGSGNIVIKNLSGNSGDDRTIPIGSGQVSFGTGANRHKVTINPTSDLTEGTSYAVQIAGTAIRDISGNYYLGIGSTDTTTWNFEVAFLPGVRVVPTTLRVPEGNSANYTVRLNTAPSGNVVIGITKQGGGDPDLSANKTSLTFNTTNWNTWQTVTVSAREDDDASRGTATFAHAITTGAGTDYPTSLNVPNVTATERDNEGPAAPTITRVENGLSGQITVHWRAGDNRAEAFQIRHRKAGQSWGAWGITYPPWPQNRFDTVAGLENGTLYYFQVRGILTDTNHHFTSPNFVAVEGAESNEFAATPRDDVITNAPQNLHASAGEERVTLSWDAVPKAQYYELSWTRDNYYADWYRIGSGTTYTESGLLADLPHTFWVRGVNWVSHGPQSEGASATPTALPPPDPDDPPPARHRRHPAAPAWLQLTPGWSNYGATITLTWAAVPNADGYQCEEKEPEEGESGWSDINFFPYCPTAGTSVTIDTYPQTSYDYRVRSYRTIGGVRHYGEWVYASIKHWEW